jgi:hypothetical protein
MAQQKEFLRASVPGTARVALQIYVAAEHGYRQPSGFSESHIRVKNRREFGRLWEEIMRVIDARVWADPPARLTAEQRERIIQNTDVLAEVGGV